VYKPATHFVGFKSDQRYQNALVAFGRPDFVHSSYDLAAANLIADEDTVIFAKGPANQVPQRYYKYGTES